MPKGQPFCESISARSRHHPCGIASRRYFMIIRYEGIERANPILYAERLHSDRHFGGFSGTVYAGDDIIPHNVYDATYLIKRRKYHDILLDNYECCFFDSSRYKKYKDKNGVWRAAPICDLYVLLISAALLIGATLWVLFL